MQELGVGERAWEGRRGVDREVEGYGSQTMSAEVFRFG